MNYGEVKSHIQSLGFEDSAAMAEYQDIIINSINRALNIINTTVKPVISEYSHTQDGTGTGLTELDMGTLVNNFERLDGQVIKTYDGSKTVFNDYSVEQDRIYFSAAEPGVFLFPYRIKITEVTVSTQDSEELTISYSVEQLLPLLASYFVWIDDDVEKATIYQNMYDDLKAQILQKTPERVTAKIRSDLAWLR